jgi:gamma-glutamylcysteine synthetase
MRTALLGLAVVGLMGSPALAQRGLPTQAAARYGWLADYAQAKEQAKRTGKPIMLVFRCIP